ncbi:MAG: hypothetical protein Q9164_006499, partial [Protoblastenia rupestris]
MPYYISWPHLALALPCLLALYWGRLVYYTVPEPYLDEVFHIRQAQAYVQGKWHIWDPKITTPPGLYLVTWMQIRVAQTIGYGEVGTRWYRTINQLATFALAWVVSRLVSRISAFSAGTEVGKKSNEGRAQKQSLGESVHSTINILLFPPLFFFYGLYYTDVLSVLSVLMTYYFHYQNEQNWVVIYALVSLFFRQTNIFWVGIYLAGLQLQRVLPRGRPSIEFPTRSTIWDVIEGSWRHACIFDPLIKDAGFD